MILLLAAKGSVGFYWGTDDCRLGNKEPTENNDFFSIKDGQREFWRHLSFTLTPLFLEKETCNMLYISSKQALTRAISHHHNDRTEMGVA